MLCSALRMEAINPTESFVSSLYAKPHPKCMQNTVRTHTFLPALICTEAPQLRHSRAHWSVSRSVGRFPGVTQADSNVLKATTYSRNNFWRCSFVATHWGKQNWAQLFHNIVCVFDWLSPFYTTLSVTFTRSVRFFPCSHELGHLETVVVLLSAAGHVQQRW